MVRPMMTPALDESALHAAAFAIQSGNPIAATDLVYVDTQPHSGRRLLLCVESLEPSERGLELAALALRTLRDVFAAAADLPPAAALMRAFTAANAMLINENRPLAGCRWERRVYVGATGVVLAGAEMIIAQVPPTAAMIVQDQRLYAFPELASWREDYALPDDHVEPEPLGCREGTRPFLFRSTAAPSDLLIFCATALAQQLGRGPEADSVAFTGGDPELALDCLAGLAVTHELDDAHAAVVQMRRLERNRRLPRFAKPLPRRAAATWPRLASPAASFVANHRAAPAAPPFAVRVDWGGVGIPLDRPLATGGEAGPLATAPAMGWRTPWAMARGRPQRDDAPSRVAPLRGAVGARTMRRYRDRNDFPLEWRALLPRGLSMQLPVRLLTLGVVALLAFGGSGALFDHYRSRSARADAALAMVGGSLRTISNDPAVAAAALAAAEQALADAQRAGADAAAIREQAYAVEAARDRVAGNLRLRNVTRLGALPTALAARPIELVRTGSDIWLVGDSLHRYDPATGHLVEALAAGAGVQGGAVGNLTGAAADDGAMVLVDDSALFAWDRGGRWARSYLAPDAVPSAGTPLAAYQGSLYTLNAHRNLLKYDAADLTAPPTVWADVGSHPDLRFGQDLVIDGRIHVMLQDGRVLTFYRQQLTGVRFPELSPPIVAPTQLVGGTDTNFLYLVEPSATVGITTGRIIRLDAEGGAAQLLPPLPAPHGDHADGAAEALAGARKVVIDEAGGVIYFITDQDLWRADLPA